ncbi:MAG: choice-of-anchor D domain-containing protein, partial [Acidobacteria bacterium]|nr:choice-of-anchor D domain-containing protein [Acidobacteriota bacterium]
MSRTYKPSSLTRLSGLLFALLLITPSHCLGALDLSLAERPHQWNAFGTSLSYGLVDLDGFDPKNYQYCKWGNWLDSDTFVFVPFHLQFDWLTRSPFANVSAQDQDKLDLFLSSDENQLRRILFPSSAVWSAPGDVNHPGLVTFFDFSHLRLTLFRYLHFRNRLANEMTGQAVGSETKKAVILIHGWNHAQTNNAFGYADFGVLRGWLINRLATTDWQLITYHWEEDADTGRISVDAAVNATEAAEIGHLHGQHLGELLNALSPGLEKVHFISHSAGAWVARAATKSLLQSNSTVMVQVSLLDPFMPNAIVRINSSLGKSVMDTFDSVPGNERIYRLENYYANDSDSLPPSFGTQEVFAWRADDTNFQVDWSACYHSHGGPISFYGDTVEGTVPNNSTPTCLNGAPYDYREVGWWRSMFMNEPLLTVDPIDQTVQVDQAVTLIAAASIRAVNLGASYDALSQLHFQWQHNGQPVGTDSPVLRIASVKDSDAGSYVLVVKNEAGTTNSRSGTVVVKPKTMNEPLIAVSRSSDLSFGFVQVGSKATKDLVVNNNGSGELLISSVTLSPPSLQSVFSANFSSGTTPAGGSRQISITFSPPAVSGYDGTMTFVSNAGNASVRVSGSGIFAAKLPTIDTGVPEVSGTSVTFRGTVSPNGSATQIWFDYGTDVNFAGSQKTGTQDIGFGTSDLVVSASANGLAANTRYYVRLVARNNVGPQNGPTVSFVTGAAFSQINMLVVAAIDFGTVPIGNSDSKVITISNPILSNGPLTGGVAALSEPFSVTSGRGPFYLQPGQSKSVVVQFAPQDESPYTRPLSITHNASNLPANSFNLVVKGSGKRLTVGIQVSPTSIVFENIPVNGSQMQWLTISNPASSAGNLIGSGGGLSSPFDLPGNNNFTSGPGGSFQIPVRFLPTIQGSFSQNLTVTHNAGNPTLIPIVGRTTEIRLTAAPESVDFGTVRVGSSVAQSVAILNDPSSTVRADGDIDLQVAGVSGGQAAPVSIQSASFQLPSYHLDPGSSSRLVLLFSPTAPGPFSGTLFVSQDNARDNPFRIPLTGTAVPAVSPESFALTVSASNGTVQKTPDQPNYALGTHVILAATPVSGFVFSGWSEDASGSDPSVEITMDRNKSVSANFVKVTPIVRTLTVTSSNPESGVLIGVSPNDSVGLNDGSTPFTRAYLDQASVILAAPDTAGGNIFQKWQKDGSDFANSSIAVVAMDRDHSMTAVYVPPPPDTTVPMVSISSPTSGQLLTTSPITVSGLASDSGTPRSQVALVEVRVNGGAWQPATGTTSWNGSVSLASGSNTLEARSRDSAGNYSTVASVTVSYYTPPDRMTVFGIADIFLAGQSAGTAFTGCVNDQVPLNAPVEVGLNVGGLVGLAVQFTNV